MHGTIPDTPDNVQTTVSAIHCIGDTVDTFDSIIARLGHDARWVLIPSGSKAPRYKGWQRTPKTAAAAAKHAARGGNVGLLCGAQSGWLIAIDADDRAGDLAQRWPVLGHTIRIWRDNAPDRCKWIVRCPQAISAKCLPSAIEILAGSLEAGTNAVVWGTHPSGARLRIEGDAVITLSLADLAAIWQWRTASTRPATGPTRNDIVATVQTPPDAAARAYNAHTPIDGLLRLAGCRQLPGGNRWIAPESTTQTAALLHNPDSNTVYAFSGRNPVGREGLLRPADWALALGLPLGAPTGPTRNDIAVEIPTPPPTQPETPMAPTALQTDVSTQWAAAYAYAARGDLAPQWRAAQRRLAAEYRQRAAAAQRQAADAVGDDAIRRAVRSELYWERLAAEAERRAAGKTWPEAGIRRLATAIVALLEARGHTASYVSGLELAAAANMSLATVRRHLDSLQPWFCRLSSRGERRAARLELTTTYDNNVAFLSAVALSPPTPPVIQCSKTQRYYHKLTDIGADIAPLRSHFAHDAVAVGWQPLPNDAATLEAVYETAERIRLGVTDAAEDTDTPPRQLTDAELAEAERWRQRLAAGYLYVARCRMGADLAALGGRGLLAIQRIWEAGGRVTGSDLAAALECSRSALSRIVGKLVDAGVVRQPTAGTIELLSDWADTLDTVAAVMPSHGMWAGRRAAWLDSAIAALEARIEQAVRDGDAQPATAPRQLAILERANQRLAEAEADRAALDNYAGTLPDPQRRRVLTRHGTWDAQQAAVADAARRRRQAERDNRDAAAEADWRQELDAAAGISPSLRQRADNLMAWRLAQDTNATAETVGG
jgi:DNA-binding MarR family transcriptional regulator